MYIKKKSIEGYFSNSLALASWRKGKVAFDEILHSVAQADDGRYECVLVDAQFEAPRARPYSVMVFELPNGAIVKKSIAIDGSEGVTRLLLDFAKFGLYPKTPVALESTYAEIRSRKQKCTIEIRTVDGLRTILIESAQGYVEKDIKQPVKQESVSAPSAPPLSTKPIVQPDPVLLPSAPPDEDEPAEVDIKPGDVIIVQDSGTRLRAKVLTEYKDEYEFAVQFESGRKAIISANDVVSLA